MFDDCEWEIELAEAESPGSHLLPTSLQGLIDTGLAWKLEGSIGRAAMDAIEAGQCTLGPVGHRDYWGNYVPAIHEVKPGTKGSLEYVEARR